MLLFLLTMSVEAAYPETGESTLKVSVVQQGTTGSSSNLVVLLLL